MIDTNTDIKQKQKDTFLERKRDVQSMIEIDVQNFSHTNKQFMGQTHTHIYTHTQREREREREKGRQDFFGR